MKLSAAPYYDHATHWKCSSIPNLLIIEITIIKFYTDVKHIHIEGTVSQILYLELSVYFI